MEDEEYEDDEFFETELDFRFLELLDEEPEPPPPVVDDDDDDPVVAADEPLGGGTLG